ncbi:MAG TPA: hypothetical protein VL242_18030 [Sorangium sp.]|nr:hypothetical protein [Sorangium sp.]
MMTSPNGAAGALVLAGPSNGITVISSSGQLKRLRYFDGKFLRASDLELEQAHARRLIQQSNQAGGWGVVHGLSVSAGPSAAKLSVSHGVAIDREGRVILLESPVELDIAELIASSQGPAPVGATSAPGGGAWGPCTAPPATPSSTATSDVDLYLVTVGWTQGACGEETVYGQICSDPCANGTERPYFIEGAILRAVPLALAPAITSTQVAFDRTHLRSRIAAAYFRREAAEVASLISGTGLGAATWCQGAELPPGRSDVPLAVLGRRGGATELLDIWTARRDRIEAPPRRYRAFRMRMRPWDVFLAHVLQFQCHLRDVLQATPATPPPVDPCAGERELVKNALGAFGGVFDLLREHGVEVDAAQLEALKRALGELEAAKDKASAGERLGVLLRRGIVELPSAGYLPVVPGQDVERQVRQLLGEGLDLRFCVTTEDYVAHALETAQHMDRISLVQGLDDPEDRPKVDVLVPGAKVTTGEAVDPRLGFKVALATSSPMLIVPVVPKRTGGSDDSPTHETSDDVEEVVLLAHLGGAGRAERFASGGGAFYTASVGGLDREELTRMLGDGGDTGPDPASDRAALEEAYVRRLLAARTGKEPFGVMCSWIALSSERDPFLLADGATTPVEARFLTKVGARSRALRTESRVRGVLKRQRLVSEGELEAEIEMEITFSRLPGDASSSTRRTASVRLVRSAEGFFARMVMGESAAPTGQPMGPAPTTEPAAYELRLRRGADGETRATLDLLVSPLKSGEQLRLPVSRVQLSPEQDVFNPTNDDHLLSLNTVKILGASLGDPRFAEEAERLLFGEPTGAAGRRVLEPTRDWVLFHRRRERDCGEERAPSRPPAEPAPEGPTYLLYHWNRARQRRPELALELAFAPGGVELRTSSSAIRAAWSALSMAPGYYVTTAIVATIGTHNDARELEMLRRCLDALAPSSVPAPEELGFQFDRMDEPPRLTPPRGADGVMVLETVDLDRVDVHRLDVEQDSSVYAIRERFEHAEGAMTLDEALSVLSAHQSQRPEAHSGELGVARYAAGAEEPLGGDVTRLADKLVNVELWAAVVFVIDDGRREISDRRARVLLDRLSPPTAYNSTRPVTVVKLDRLPSPDADARFVLVRILFPGPV